MFTIKNYFARLKEVNRDQLPSNLKEAFDFVKEATQDHKNWDYYHADVDIKASIDVYLRNLSDHFNIGASSQQIEDSAKAWAKEIILDIASRGFGIEYFRKAMEGSSTAKGSYTIKNGKITIDKIGEHETNFSFTVHSIYNDLINSGSIKPKTSTTTKTKKSKNSGPNMPKKKASRTKGKNHSSNPVEKIDEEVRFIKRFILLHGKSKTEKQILMFINSLQKAIAERRIRKNSKHAVEIEYIQSSLIKTYNNMGAAVTVKINDNILDQFQSISGSQQVRLTTSYIKKYIGLQGKMIDKEKARKLSTLIHQAISNGTINKSDPYYPPILRIQKSLHSFVKIAKPTDTLQIHTAILNGISEALDGCCSTCDKKKVLEKENENVIIGAGHVPEHIIINSLDFAKYEFDTLGFSGVWRDFFGDPAKGFTVMVSAFPKFGKSTFCALFAGYLARNHGDTLYVASEEKAGSTLQKKLSSVAHQSLYVVGAIPEDLTRFDFVFLDSVSSLKLEAEDLRSLKMKYPGTSFIFVFQVNKNGVFRGSNELQHDVDMIVELPQKGLAVQFGRFNQGGEMKIFSEAA